MKTSFFELFKIGIGPSSSHTVGPMRAARAFATALARHGKLEPTARVRAELYGSLALTGKGHGTDRAVILGLMGEAPDEIDPASIDHKFGAVRQSGSLRLAEAKDIPFTEVDDLIFHKDKILAGHSNGMRFTALDSAGEPIATDVYYSVGGGFIQKEGEAATANDAQRDVSFPFSSAEDLLRIGDNHGIAIWEIALANEMSWRPESEVRAYVERVWQTMEDCLERGINTEGILPGGLKVRRRAPGLYKKLSLQVSNDPLAPMDWVNTFAMAVNEENAAGGRVVTAPTNGAAGIVPAVGHYYLRFVPEASDEGIFRYLLTAGAIGILYKENASISGAEVGCQGEVGVACSMAAGGLVAALGGNNRQVEYAAEIGMEHNLGMTCDPIGGLVQIPCIERNAMGAVKAINACRIAMRETGEHKVSLDQVIQTMYQTGLDMQSRYKETSLAGLALNVIEC
ncbi:MAG: L-serine ammonia-lyase [Terriglobia bacterium]|jgi:L-serine dehydratase|nr:L-serine ammonia-lyase [Terriglobia bacterium]